MPAEDRRRLDQQRDRTPREILSLAGPNGAGKTTFAREFLLHEAHCPTFINADLIAAGLSPFTPELVAMRAGRLMVQMMREHVERGESFAFETTLADRGFARSIPKFHRGARKLRERVRTAGRRLGPLRQFRLAPSSGGLGPATMNPKPIAQAKDPLLAAALPALLRARQRAEEIAIATNTPLVQVIDGKVVRVYPQADGKIATEKPARRF